MRSFFEIIIVPGLLLLTVPAHAGCYFPAGEIRATGSAPLVFGTFDAWQDAKGDAFRAATELCRDKTASLAVDGDSYWELSSKPIMGGQMGYATNVFGCGPKKCIWPY